MKFGHLKPGDRVIRMLAGQIAMPMQVRDNVNGVITCDAVQEDGSIFPGAWTFSADNGGEIDSDLGWNPPHTPTGSFLRLED